MSALAVFGVPVHNNEAHVEEAIASLLGQTYSPFAVVAVDDASTDRSPELVAAGGIASLRSERQLGLIGAWRRAFDFALETHPDARYFAWGSDHDRWDPRWLESLVRALEEHPNAVLAHPHVDAIDDDGETVKRRQRQLDTTGVADPLARVGAVAHARRAGDMVYGLMRVEAMRKCGPFPDALSPDRLFLARLALEGEFVQVDDVLWHRRYRTGVAHSYARQRRSLWGGHVPRSARVPWQVQHWLWLRRNAPGGSRIANSYLRETRRALAAQRREQLKRRWHWRRKRLREAVRTRGRAG